MRSDAFPNAGDDGSEALSDVGWILGRPTVGRLLESVAENQRRSARILRARGRASDAQRAEQAAGRIMLTLEQPKATRHLYALTRALRNSSNAHVLLESALDGAMSLLGANFGNIQLRCLANGPPTLRITTQFGFGSEFLEYFAIVDDHSSACGRAATEGSQIVIADVNIDARFAPHQQIAAASGFRAVQSTPLIDPAGRLRGVVSTHFRHPHQPDSLRLELIRWYAEEIAATLARRLNTPTTLYTANATLHQAAAQRHDATALLLTERRPRNMPDRDEMAAETRERARQERDRAHTLTARAQTRNPRHEIPPGATRPPSPEGVPAASHVTSPTPTSRPA